MRSRFTKSAFHLSLLYAGSAVLWILLFEKLLPALVSDPVAAANLETYTRWAFVIVTAGLLYWGLRRPMRRWEQETDDGKQTAETIVHEHQLHRRLLDLLPDGIYIKDLDSRFLMANETLAKRFGKDNPAQVLGLSDKDFFPPEIAAVFRADEEKVFAGETINKKEEIVLFPNGQKRMLLTTKVPFRNSQGQICGLVGIGRDITEHDQAETALRRSEERLRQIVTQTRCILKLGEVTGPEGWQERALSPDSPFHWNLQVENEATAQEVFPLELLPGERYQQAWSRSFHPEDQAQMNRNSGYAFLHNAPFYRNEFRCTDKHGLEHWMQQYMTVEKLAGNRWRVFGITTDISSLKNAEKTLRKTNRALRMISDCNQALIRATNEADLLTNICRLVAEEGGYAMAWVGYAGDDEAKSVRSAAQAGTGIAYLKTCQVTWADEPRGRGPVGTAIRTGQMSIFRNLNEKPEFAPWREQAQRYGYQSVISLPLAADGKVFGALSIYSTQEDAFDEDEASLLNELAGDLAFGIIALRAQAECRRTDAALRRSEERLRLAQAAAKIGIFDVDLTRDHATWTEEEEAIYGFAPGTYDHNSKTFWQLIHPEDRGRIQQLTKSAIAQHSEFHAEYRFHRHGDQALRWALVGGKAVYDETGRPVRLLGVNIDVTEHKQAEAALRMSEALYHSLVEQMPVGVFRKDVEGRYVFVNAPFCQLGGWKPEQLIGKTPEGFEHAVLEGGSPKLDESTTRKLAAQGREHHALIMRTGQMIEIDEERTLTNGEKQYFHVVKTPVRDLDGKIIGTQGILIDITQRRQAEELTRRLATAVEQAADDILITDAQGTIQYVNPVFEATTGYTRQEVIGQNPRLLKSGKHDATFYKRMWEVLTCGEVWSGRIINRKKDGTLFEEDATISPIRDSSGKIVNYVGVRHDVTREVALEAQLRQAQKMEAIGHLAGGVAHDFNNLLTAIHGNASLLLDTQLESREKLECAAQIVEAAERAATLTRQLLLFSHKQAMQPINLDLNEVVTQITKMLQRILGEDISLTSNYGANLPAIRADTGMIEQVILNLAINARDAMPKGGRLIISTGTEMTQAKTPGQNPDDPPRLHVWLEVTDNGCGIPPEILPHIFEPFFTTKPVGKGTGLGLATVYGIVQQHHGWITVNSKVNQGTTFRLCFPAAIGTDARKKITAAKSPLPRGSETILIVEDELPVRTMVNNLLQRCGYTTLQAESGVTALKIWQEQKDRIQLVLTDIIMPDGMTGYDLARQLHAEKPQLKIIFTSGYSGDVVDKRLALIEGVNFLQKPYTPSKLAETLRKNLNRG